LWFAYEVPTTEEIARVIYNFLSMVRRRKRPWRLISDDVFTFECIALAMTMIATGASMEEACQLRVCGAEQDPGQYDLVLQLNDKGRRAKWRLRASLPEYQTEQVPDPFMTSFMEVPDVVHAALLARILLRVRGAKAPVSCTPLFPYTEKEYSTFLRALLRRFDTTDRTTIKKLPKFLFAHLVSQSGGDVADACLASRHWHYLARVPTFYSTPSARRLQQLYATTVNNVGKQVRSAVRQFGHIDDDRIELEEDKPIRLLDAKRHEPPPATTRGVSVRLDIDTPANGCASEQGQREPETEMRVGNRRCPTEKQVQLAIEDMKQRISDLSHGKKRRLQIDRHNLITLYTIEFFAACVGVRGVTTPYLRLDEVDAETGFTVLTEKTVRAVWLPPAMVRQMETYERYLRSQDLVQPLPTFGDKQPAPCFLIDSNGAVEIRPTVKTDYLRKYLKNFDYPANIFRRFIRNRLREKCCPASVVKAWLGHAARGEEIHHVYAQFSLGAYREALQDYLEPILEDVGFTCLQISCPK
jgi:hypothetical protein